MRCAECGQLAGWTSPGSSSHTDEHHEGVRRRLYRALRVLLDRETDVKLWRAHNAAQGLVGIRWRNGVYPGWQSEERWELPYEWWDGLYDGDQTMILRVMREHLSERFERDHGVRVNQATWFHRIYDGRQT